MGAVQLPDLDPEAQVLWTTLADLVDRELGQWSQWCLIGGLMVQLFAFENDATVRPTSDIDLLADARTRPSRTEQIATALQNLGATLLAPSSTGTAYQFDLDGTLVEILGPDGLGDSDPTTIGNFKTVQVPGGTQALTRTEEVTLVLAGDRRITLRRPTLTGAILLKTRSLPKHQRPEDQREDLIALLSFVPDPRTMRAQMTKTERQWLRKVDQQLNLEDLALTARFSTETLTRARQAFHLLVG